MTWVDSFRVLGGLSGLVWSDCLLVLALYYGGRTNMKMFLRLLAIVVGFGSVLEVLGFTRVWTNETREILWSLARLVSATLIIPVTVGLMRLPSVKKLDRERLRFQEILDTSMSGFIITSRFGLVLFWNKQAERMFGWTKEEVDHKPIEMLVVPERIRQKHLEMMRSRVREDRERLVGYRIQSLALRKDGSEFPVEISLVQLPEPGGEFAAFIRDISVVHELGETKEVVETLKIYVERLREQLASKERTDESIESSLRKLEELGGA